MIGKFTVAEHFLMYNSEQRKKDVEVLIEEINKKEKPELIKQFLTYIGYLPSTELEGRWKKENG